MSVKGLIFDYFLTQMVRRCTTNVGEWSKYNHKPTQIVIIEVGESPELKNIQKNTMHLNSEDL